MPASDLVGPLLAASAVAVALGPSSASVRLRRLQVTRTAGARSGGAGPDGRPSRRQGAGLLSGAWARVAAASLAGVCGAWLLGGSIGLVAGPALGAAAWVGLGRLEPADVARARERTARTLPLVADLLAAALAAGSPPVTAVEAVGLAVGGPLGAALKAAAASARVGIEPSSAWMGLASEPALRPLARALAGAVTRGASPVASLERVAHDARDAARWAAEARARSLGAKAAAPLGLCFLPAFVLVGIVPIVVTAGPLLP